MPGLCLADVDSVLLFITLRSPWLFFVFVKCTSVDSGARGGTAPSRASSPPSAPAAHTDGFSVTSHLPPAPITQKEDVLSSALGGVCGQLSECETALRTL